MGKHAYKRGRGWFTRLTHHPQVARWVQTRDRLVLGAVGLVTGMALLMGCEGSGPRQLGTVPVLERAG